MARKQRKISGDIHTRVGSIGAELLGLDPPFGAAPYRPNEHFLYISKGDNFMGVGFGATYSARKFLDVLLQDDELSLTRGISGKEDTVVSSSGIIIRADNIMDIINYKYEGREEEWELNEDGNSGSARQAERFRSSSGIRVERTEESSTEGEPHPKREKKEKAPRPSKEGLISIGQVAEDLKMEARDCRAILRKMKVEKPACGWAWSKTDVDDIKKLIEKNRDK